MATKGWIHKFAFENDALSADTTGRQAMADSFLTNEKIANSQITAIKLASGSVLVTGVYGASRYGSAVFG